MWTEREMQPRKAMVWLAQEVNSLSQAALVTMLQGLLLKTALQSNVNLVLLLLSPLRNIHTIVRAIMIAMYIVLIQDGESDQCE